MDKILLIIKREYLTRVKKRSFVVMTFLGPILMAALFIVPAYIAMRDKEKENVTIVDETGIFASKFKNTENYTFFVSNEKFADAKAKLSKTKDYVLLYIPSTKLNVPNDALLYSDKQPSLSLKEHVERIMNKEVEQLKLAAEIRKELIRFSPNYAKTGDTTAQDYASERILKNINSDIKITSFKIDEDGNEKKSMTELNMIIGYIASLTIYMFIFMFGAQVMRGVIEEKTNRIVEVIISSVKPFQLMAGKIIGIALVGLTQFVLWIVFTFVIVTAVTSAFPETFGKPATTQQMVMQNNTNNPISTANTQTAENNVLHEALSSLSSINLPVMLISFLIYFLFGYLLYGALFAAIGGAVDNETDSQQFMMPITIPLILAIVMAQTVIQNPNSSLSSWLSMIPFTSPVIMMVRIPFGVPVSQIILSVILLIGGFIFTTWIAAKIFRVGILMYGKKVNYRELWKWIRYKG